MKSKGLVVVIAIALIYFLFERIQFGNSLIGNDTNVTTTTSISDKKLDSLELQKFFHKPSESEELDCETIKYTYLTPKYNKWAFKQFPSGDDLLEQGYGADEITLAIEYFRNNNFSNDWRIKYLKQNSRFNQENISITQQIESIVGKLLPENMSVRINYPRSEFDDFSSYSKSEQINILRETNPTVDDIAALMKNKKIDQITAQLMLKYVDDATQLVGDKNTQSMTLLDYSIGYGYLEMFRDLLKLGVEPTQGSYLYTSLDFALRRLSYQLENSKNIDNIVEIIKSLISLENTARIEAFSPSRIASQSVRPFPFYEFSNEQIGLLLNKYSLDLLSMHKTQRISQENTANSVIANYKELRKIYVSEHLLPRHLEAVNGCQLLD